MSSPYTILNESILDNKQLQNLHALTLTLEEFEDIFKLIELTPNLKYLKLQTSPPFIYYHPPTNINIKLEQFYLILTRKLSYSNSDSLIRSIKQISSSSLTCLSLNLIGLDFIDEEEFPFNSKKLQNLLQSMTKLKRFDLYATLGSGDSDKDMILSQFRSQYWIDHNWSFGMHGKYSYTLSFPFENLYDFYQGFDDVKLNNPEILIDNPRIWYNVKSIELLAKFNYDRNFINQLKIKMPKLNRIKFDDYGFFDEFINEKSTTSNHQLNDIDVTLDSVTTIEFAHEYNKDQQRWSIDETLSNKMSIDGYFQKQEQWLMNIAPNLTHLILTNQKLPSVESRLTQVLNQKIRRLDINENTPLKQLVDISYTYFSNVRYIKFCLNLIRLPDSLQGSADMFVKLLVNFKSLEQLRIFYPDAFSIGSVLTKFIDCLHMNEIEKNYEMKHFGEYSLFLKY